MSSDLFIVMPVVETRGLTKKFGRITAVEDLNISIDEGEVFGLLGPNGAGKTTIIKMLATLLEPTSGSARVNGFGLVFGFLSLFLSCNYCRVFSYSYAGMLNGAEATFTLL